MSVEFLIGADPELFVRDRNGNLVSAYGMVPGTKSCPYEVEGGAVQVDGMALEFNINPASTFEEFNSNIVNVLRQMKEMIPNGYSFDFSPVAQFGKEYIQSQPEEARLLGCDPDYSAHTGDVNPKPDADYDFRTASGHIHIGWTNAQDVNVPEHIEACQMAVKQLDVTIGLFARKWDKDRIRSTMYGKFGAYRPKHYGVEYRTLSNTWVNEEDRRRLVFNASMMAMEKLMGGTRLYDYYFIPDFDNLVSRGRFSDLNYYAQSIATGYMGINIAEQYVAIKEVKTANPFDNSIHSTNSVPQPMGAPALPAWMIDEALGVEPNEEFDDFEDEEMEA